MAEPFGRGSRSRGSRSRRIRVQCGGSCTSNKSRLVTKRKVVKNHHQQLPPINQNCFSLKAGTAKQNNSLSLDPQRNHHRPQHQYPVVLNSKNVEEEKQEEGEKAIADHSPKQNCNQQDFPPSPLPLDQHFCPRLGLDKQLQQPLKRRSYFCSSSSSNIGKESIQYARKMGESHNQAAASSRLGIRNAGGEIVEVQGGHIVRSAGRKDRHSKVCTAKGPRDRRVRLSAHTAIQFYDVQDRLGYDRPSKAVDWLIKKAKTAIDELAELPPWDPETVTNTAATTKGRAAQQSETNEDRNYQFPRTTATIVGSSNDVMVENPNQSSSFLPPSLDSDSIAATIKSFFPMGDSTDTPSSSINFQSYPPDLLSRTTSHSQDLRLSLQSFQEPNNILLQHQTHHHAHSQVQQQHQNEQVQVLFSGTTPLGYDNASAAWSESEHQHHHSAEIARFQRMMAWNSGTVDTAGSASGGAGGFVFSSHPPPPLQPLFGQNQLFNSQRGPLQSSNTPSVRAWIDQPMSLTNEHNHHHHHHHHHQILPSSIHQSVISSIGFASPVGEFSGFGIPARIQGEDEEHDGITNKPSSASSDSRH